jgi:hypothetical protein
VPHRAANVRSDTRVVAAPHRSARKAEFRHSAGVPADVWVGNRRTDILNVTIPHDCERHLVGLGL